jgi:DNA-binding transcriptional MocR family regulator
MEHRRLIVLDARVGDVRRRVGPTAWAILEELLTRSIGAGPLCEATATTRSLAGGLGVSKDTVARALRRLRHAGVVVDVVQHRTTAGAYGAGRYVIAVPAGIILPDPATTAPPTPSGPATRPDAQRVASQLTFVLDPEI